MALVSHGLMTISDADSATDWSGTSGGLDSEVFKQQTTGGTGGAYTYQTGKNSIESMTYTHPTSLDLSLDTAGNIYWTMRCDVFPFCEDLNTGATNSGLMFRITDTAGSYKQWHVAGADTWDGSWKTFVFNARETQHVHSSSGTLDYSIIKIFTWITDNSNSGIIRIIDNTWVDSVKYGRYLNIASTTTEDVSFQDMADFDQSLTKYLGVLQDVKGVLFAQGQIGIGQDGDVTNFVSENETIYFRDVLPHVGSLFIEATSNYASLVDHADTSIDITGLVCKSVGAIRAGVVFSNNEDSFGTTETVKEFHLVGSTFIDMSNLTLGYNLSTTLQTCISNSFTGCNGIIRILYMTIEDCSFTTCSVIILDNGNKQAYIDNCLISEPISTGVYTADLEAITDCTFISDGTNNHAAQVTSVGDGTMNWNNYLSGYASSDGSVGNEAIFVSASSGTLTINVGTGYDTPSIRTGGATVTVISGQVTTTITVKNQDGDVIVGARVYLIAAAGGPLSAGTVIFNTITNASGQVTDTRALASDQPVEGWSRDSTAPSPYYKQSTINEIIDNALGLNLNMLLILDE